MKIVRVPPHFPVYTWCVGTKGLPFMQIERKLLPALVKSLSKYVLDKGHGIRSFSC